MSGKLDNGTDEPTKEPVANEMNKGDKPEQKSEGASLGVIIAIFGGIVLLLAAVVTSVIIVIKKRRRGV